MKNMQINEHLITINETSMDTRDNSIEIDGHQLKLIKIRLNALRTQ